MSIYGPDCREENDILFRRKWPGIFGPIVFGPFEYSAQTAKFHYSTLSNSAKRRIVWVLFPSYWGLFFNFFYLLQVLKLKWQFLMDFRELPKKKHISDHLASGRVHG
jgi:hypothetical protein